MKKLLILILMLLCIPFPAYAQVVTVTGMGGSEKTALKDAMRLAVESALGVYITSQTVSENYTVIRDRINSYGEGYITRYEIIDKVVENGLYRITVKADVRDDVKNLILSDKEKRAKIKASLSDPRIAVKAADKSGKYSKDVESAFISGLNKIGFSRIVNNSNNADFFVAVIVSENKTGAFGADFTVNAKITRVKDGEVVFVGSESAMGSGMAGRKSAVKRAVDKILKKMDVRALELATNPENHILLIISNVEGNITLTKNYLSELPGVNNVYLRKSVGNLSEYDLDYLGNTADFVELLESKGFKIKKIEGNVVKI